MNDKQLLSLLRLVRFMVRSSAMHDSIFKQAQTLRDSLFSDEYDIDELIDELEEQTK